MRGTDTAQTRSGARAARLAAGSFLAAFAFAAPLPAQETDDGLTIRPSLESDAPIAGRGKGDAEPAAVREREREPVEAGPDDGVTEVAPPEVFRVGLVPEGDALVFLKALAPMRDGLGGALGRPVEIVPMASLGALIDAQSLKRVDAAFYSASAYAVADRLCRCVEPLVAPAAADGTTSFHGVIVARRDSGLSGVADLKGRHVATAGPDSVAGRRMQLAALAAEGVDPATHFGRVEDVGSTLEAVRLVRDGVADAAFAWSSLAGAEASGYSRGTLATLAASREIEAGEFTVIWRSEPIPHAPVAVLKSLDPEVKAAARTYFLNLDDTDPATYDLLDRRHGGGYRVVEPSAYFGVGILADEEVEPARDVAILPMPRERPQPVVDAVEETAPPAREKASPAAEGMPESFGTGGGLGGLPSLL